MGAKCEVQEKSLQTLGSYYVERRNLELKINTLEGEIKELEESARAATKENKEKTAAIADLQTKMNSLKMTNSKIKMCLVQTAGSIKLALDLQVRYRFLSSYNTQRG